MSAGGYVVGPTLDEGEPPFRQGWEWDEACKACVHPLWENVLVVERVTRRFQECVRCVECHAPRCGHSIDPDPCMRVRHHGGDHIYLSGTADPVGGYRR